MAAAYDSFDYPAYWEGREYEHESEVIAIQSFLKRVPRINKIADLGGGYGRMVKYYIHRARKVELIDPSNKLLAIARRKFKKIGEGKEKITFINSTIETIGKKKRKNSYDMIIMVRVIHHVKDLKKTITTVEKLLKPGGYLILEFPNKIHLKAIITNFIKGNITYLIDIFPEDKRCKKNIKNKTLPFLNFHPDVVNSCLRESGFKIIEKRSVSNIRSARCKKMFPLTFLVWMEEKLQRKMACINFGPSLFLLAKKRNRKLTTL